MLFELREIIKLMLNATNPGLGLCNLLDVAACKPLPRTNIFMVKVSLPVDREMIGRLVVDGPYVVRATDYHFLAAGEGCHCTD